MKNLLLVLLFCMGLSPIIAQQSFVVNSILDTPDSNPNDGICDDGNGNCTLRAAIDEHEDWISVPQNTTITFDPSIFGMTINTTGYRNMNDLTDLTIEGPGAEFITINNTNDSEETFTVKRTNISGLKISGGRCAIFLVSETGTYNFDRLIVQNVGVSQSEGLSPLFLTNADAIFSNSIVSGNRSGANGGGIKVTDRGGTIDIINCTIVKNETEFSGGGLRQEGGTVNFNNNIICDNINTHVHPNSPNPYIEGGIDLFRTGGGTFNLGTNFISINDFSGSGAMENGTTVGTHDMPVDPLFVMEPSDPLSMDGDLGLQDESAALNSGDNSVVVGTMDVNGDERIQDEVVNLGAVESPFMVLPIPTMGQWGLIILALLLITFGVLGYKKSLGLRKTV